MLETETWTAFPSMRKLDPEDFQIMADTGYFLCQNVKTDSFLSSVKALTRELGAVFSWNL